MTDVRIASSDLDIARCFPVMRQLRRNLTETEFVPRVRLQEREGYRLAYVAEEDAVRAVAGFRFLTNLVSGRILYVDDLATDEAERSRGYGARLFAWLVEQARAESCAGLELDSGVQRFGAHRFYLRQRMEITSHHFRLSLG